MTFHVLLRVSRIVLPLSKNETPRLLPRWWTIQDHDGRNHAIAGNDYTIAVCALQSQNLDDAQREFAAQYALFAPLLDGVPCVAGDYGWTAKLEAFEHDERMAGFWMDRAQARRDNKPLPAAPKIHAQIPAPGSYVRIGLSITGHITRVHGDGWFELEPERTVGIRCLALHHTEVIGVIEMGGRGVAAVNETVFPGDFPTDEDLP